MIRAAGGVVWRDGPAGREMCLVHRPRYDDWSLPKGKLDAGELPIVGAVREVAEETGVRAVPLVRLRSVSYEVHPGVPKVVDFWSMRAADSDGFAPNAEVDALRWLTAPGASELASYPHDVAVLREAAELPAVTGSVLLFRHAMAGERGGWVGTDSDRPLDEVGLGRARRLVPLLAIFAPERILSAPPRRCVQTVTPLAEATGLPVEVDLRFDENADPALAAAALRELAAAGATVVVCSQRGVMPGALALLRGDGAADRFRTEKGAGWLLAFAGDRLLGVDGVTPADAAPTGEGRPG